MDFVNPEGFLIKAIETEAKARQETKKEQNGFFLFEKAEEEG
jgi:hypothetical protein